MIQKVSFSGNTGNDFPALKSAEEKCQKLGKVYPMSDIHQMQDFSAKNLYLQHMDLAKNDEKLAAQLDLIAEQNKAIIAYNKSILNGLNTLFDVSFRF